jgi:hypothetical protein
MSELNDDFKEYKDGIQSDRMKYAKEQITALGYEIIFEDRTKLQFEFNGKKVNLFPYTGWHTGPTIKDGRGIENLLKQIKKQ